MSAIPGEKREKKKWKMMRMRWRVVRPSRRLFLLPYLSSDDEAVTVGLNSTRLYSSKEGRNSLFKWKPANLQNMIEAALLRPFV